MTKHDIQVLRETITLINKVIAKVHATSLDFAKGSLEQRLINDLDGARVTTRALLHTKETTNADTNHPQAIDTDGRVRNRKEPSG